VGISAERQGELECCGIERNCPRHGETAAAVAAATSSSNESS